MVLIGRESREIQNNLTIKSTYTVITTEFVRLFLFISREKATVASRNVGISAKYVIKIYAFGSAHVKFSVWVTGHRQSVRSPGGGGHLGFFWVGMCRPGLQIGAPF